MAKDIKPTKEEQEKNDRLMELVRENTKNMTDKQTNDYIQHLKNKLKDEKKR
jgi:hypothetical protein